MKGIARLPELFDQVRAAQREIDQTRIRIQKNLQENRFDEALIAKQEERIKDMSKSITEARAEQAEINRAAALRGRS